MEKFEAPELVDNEAEHRFEWHIAGSVAFLEYKRTPHQLVLIHTEVPEALQGKGIAPALVTKVLEYAESRELKVIPLCVYVLAFLKKHPEWSRVLDVRVK